MKFLEELRNRKGLSIGIAALLFGVCIVTWWLRSNSADGAMNVDSGKIWLTTDDGKTFFPSEGAVQVPITVNGKEAVRAHVYSTDGGKTKSTLYLERIQPEVKKKTDGKTPVFDPMAGIGGVEVKRPGDAQWILRTDPKAAAITEPKSNMTPVYP